MWAMVMRLSMGASYQICFENGAKLFTSRTATDRRRLRFARGAARGWAGRLDEYGELHHRLPSERTRDARSGSAVVGGRIARMLSSSGYSTASSGTTTPRSWRARASTVSRLPINQRHFESGRAFRMAFERFRATFESDRARSAPTASTASSTCTPCPGCQNQHWHSDNSDPHRGLLAPPALHGPRDRLWVELAERFADNEWVAGYNLLDEPADPPATWWGPARADRQSGARGRSRPHPLPRRQHLLDRLLRVPRAFANAIYACHDYAAAGMAFGGTSSGPGAQLEEKFRQRTSLPAARPGRRSGWASSVPSTPACRSSTSSA